MATLVRKSLSRYALKLYTCVQTMPANSITTSPDLSPVAAERRAKQLLEHVDTVLARDIALPHGQNAVNGLMHPVFKLSADKYTEDVVANAGTCWAECGRARREGYVLCDKCYRGIVALVIEGQQV
jgi:hypothetical protein